MGARMDAFHSNLMTPQMTGMMAASTAGTLNQCIGGTSTGAQIATSIFGSIAAIGTAAMTSGAQGTQQANPEATALASKTGNISSMIAEAQTARTNFSTLNGELQALKDRQSASTDNNLQTMKNDLNALTDNFEEARTAASADGSALKTAENTVSTLNKALSDIAAAETKINSVPKGIESKTVANTLSGTGSQFAASYNLDNGPENIGGSSATNVANNHDKYKTENGGPGEATYNQDFAKAQEMDQDAKTIATQRKTLKEGQEAMAKALKDAGCQTKDQVTTKLATAKDEVTKLQGNNIEGKDGKSMSIAEYDSKKAKLEADIKAAEGDQGEDLATQIKNKEADLKNKKATLETKRDAISNKLNELNLLKGQMTSAADTSGVSQAKSDFKAAKKTNNKDRNFFQKMFGAGKSQARKDAKQALKNEKAAAKQNYANFTMNNGFQASAGNVAQIQTNINMLQNELNDINGVLKKSLV